MSSRLVAVSFDAHDPAGVAGFWSGLLDRKVVVEAGGALLPGEETQVGLRFVAATTQKGSAPNRLHLHLTSSTPDDQERTIEVALRLGGQPVDVGQLPEEGHVVLADPGGNEFCVIEPGNNFLTDCGYLGEVSCAGPRQVGLFWRDALGWALVWDRDEETAVQSPRGGTKVSWGGEPADADGAGSRQRFDLATTDVAAEVRRLVALGATELGTHDERVELADPGGTVFTLGPEDPPTT